MAAGFPRSERGPLGVSVAAPRRSAPGAARQGRRSERLQAPSARVRVGTRGSDTRSRAFPRGRGAQAVRESSTARSREGARRASPPPRDRRQARACRAPPLPRRPSLRRARATRASSSTSSKTARFADDARPRGQRRARASTASRAPGDQAAGVRDRARQAPHDLVRDLLGRKADVELVVHVPRPFRRAHAHHRARGFLRPGAAVLMGDFLARRRPDLLGVDENAIEVEDDRCDHAACWGSELSSCERRAVPSERRR